jgi:hypothetical protein
MSQIVTAFAAPSIAIPEADRHLNLGDWKGFWEHMRPFAFDIAFPYSAYAVVVAFEYLRGMGIELPISSDPAVRRLVEKLAPLVCTDGPGVSAMAAALAGVTMPDAILAAFWSEFTGDDHSEAGTIMRAALDCLRQAVAAGKEADWIIILEG